MIDKNWAKNFAEEWISSWNAHDLERILSHYTDDFEMSSPLIVARMNEPSGTLKGKDKIRPYWRLGLSSSPPLRFELINFFTSINSIAIHYRRNNGTQAVETLFFDEQQKVVKGVAHY